MAITASSTTAFDVPTLVSQLMGVERRPIDKLEAKVASYETKISSFGTLSSLVSSFQTAAKGLNTGLPKLSATPSDAGVMSASAGSTAVPGTYAVSVSQLAQSHNLVAAGQASSTAAIGDGTATTGHVRLRYHQRRHDADLIPAFQDMDGFLLLVMTCSGGPPFGATSTIK